MRDEIVKDEPPSRDSYREAARRLYAVPESLRAFGLELKVPEHANVMPLPDGAFVEVTVWVPRAEAAREAVHVHA